jgi:DNA-binding NarL/FixJ family response regulator
VRALLVDDHAVTRAGLADLLAGEPGLEVVAQAGTVAEALAVAHPGEVDVAIVDLQLPDGDGIELCRELRAGDPGLKVLILTAFDDDQAHLAALAAGATGYVLKLVRGDVILGAVRAVASGRALLDRSALRRLEERARTSARGPLAGLSARELDVLREMADGSTNREIGTRLGLSDKTVKNYVSSVLSKLGVVHRTEAAVLAIHELTEPTATWRDGPPTVDPVAPW